PLLGAPGGAPFDPGNVLFLILPLGAAMKAWTLLRLMVSVAGFGHLSRRLGLDRSGAAVAALTWGLGGVSVSLAAFPGAFSALSILPCFGAFVLDVRVRPSARNAAKLAGATALLLVAGAPEFVFYAGAAALALGFRAPAEAAPAPARRFALALFLAAVLGAGLAAPALLPAWDAGSRSPRAPRRR